MGCTLLWGSGAVPALPLPPYVTLVKAPALHLSILAQI